MEPITLTKEQIDRHLSNLPDYFRFDSATLVPFEWCEAKYVVRNGLLGGHLPGVYSIQLSVCASLLMRLYTPGWKEKYIFILGVNRTRFYKELIAGDELRVYTKIVKIREDKPVVTLDTTIYRGDELAIDMEIAIYLANPEQHHT